MAKTLEFIREELKRRVKKHKKWYALWVIVNITASIFAWIYTGDPILTRRILSFINMGLVLVDEYHVMGHGTKITDLFGYRDKKTGRWLPTHELIAFILFLLTIL